MNEKLKRVWRAICDSFGNIKLAWRGEKADKKVQDWKDIFRRNLLNILVSKTSNLSCNEATFDLQSDSVLVDPLKALCKDLETNRFSITKSMLGTGNCIAVPALNEKGELYHSYLDKERYRILSDGEEITKIGLQLEEHEEAKGSKKYLLFRIHELDSNGTLTISYLATDEAGKSVTVDKWKDLTDSVTQFAGANHIGVGIYKSPASSRNIVTQYGVPMNFGTSEEESRIVEDVELIDDEGRNGKSVVFTDPRNLKFERNDSGEVTKVKGFDNIIPIKRNAGDSGTFIDIYNPNLRFSDYYIKLQHDLVDYEQAVGLNKGVLTEADENSYLNKDTVRRANADTISYINSIHSALDEGNRNTLIADSIFLNIRNDLWEYSADYFDPFEDVQTQFERLVVLHDKGAITTKRLLKWQFPNMTDEEIEQELAEIGQAKTNATNDALARVLNM